MSSGIKDYYAILGVERDATAEEIKKAFRLKARECHPDVCATEDGEERFKEVNEAYEVLSDPNKRDVYDRFGTADPRASQYGGFDGVPYEDIFGMGMEDVFSMFFGTSTRSARRVRREGRDLSAQVVITLEEAAAGAEKELDLTRVATCEKCDGKGGDEVSVTACPDCQGTGQRTVVRQTFLGQMRTVAPCDACGQTGEAVSNGCDVCGGTGRAPKRERVGISVPAGIQDGASIRIPGAGEAGIRGSQGGDLIVGVRVAPHERVFREGDDLHVQVRIPLTTAALGGTVRFHGLVFEEEAKVAAGTQPGDFIRIKGRGMPKARGNGAGDLIAHVAVDVPKKLSKAEKQLLEKLDEKLGPGEKPVSVDRLRDWLGHR